MTTTINLGEFKAGQHININNDGISRIFAISKVTEKALCIKLSDGKWNGNGFNTVWLPLSQIESISVNDNPKQTETGIHNVYLPNWLMTKVNGK